MKREQARLRKELQKKFTAEIKTRCKKHGFKYAYEFLYLFEGDFVYYACPYLNFSAESSDTLNTSAQLFIKPWALNETYWLTQSMDMEEMLSQPKNIHFRGAFTVDDVYSGWEIITVTENPSLITEDTPAEAAGTLLCRLKERVSEHGRTLTNADALLNYPEGYQITNLTAAVIHIKQGNFEEAHRLLNDKNPVTGSYTQKSGGKTASQITDEYCLRQMNKGG